MISVITVSRNARGTIHDCLTSVTAQSVRPEHVIVDGASTDGTLELLRGWTGHRLELVSEPDQGIYDAMNKGIARARGEIVGILNADDGYASDRVLEQVREAMSDPGVDACYGDLVYVKGESGDEKTSSETLSGTLSGLGTSNAQPPTSNVQRRTGTTETPKHRSTGLPNHPLPAGGRGHGASVLPGLDAAALDLFRASIGV